MPKSKSFEIDDLDDFKIVESIIKNKEIFKGK
jgi:CMP-N-acetylneuraminic acid synthetase